MTERGVKSRELWKRCKREEKKNENPGERGGEGEKRRGACNWWGRREWAKRSRKDY